MPEMLWATLCHEATERADHTIDIRGAGILNLSAGSLAEIPPFVLVGQIAYGDELEPEQLARHWTHVVDPSGRRIWTVPSTTFPTGPESFQMTTTVVPLGDAPFSAFGEHAVIVTDGGDHELIRIPIALVQR